MCHDYKPHFVARELRPRRVTRPDLRDLQLVWCWNPGVLSGAPRLPSLRTRYPPLLPLSWPEGTLRMESWPPSKSQGPWRPGALPRSTLPHPGNKVHSLATREHSSPLQAGGRTPRAALDVCAPSQAPEAPPGPQLPRQPGVQTQLHRRNSLF